MTNVEGRTNSKVRMIKTGSEARRLVSRLVIRHSFGFRHSDFGIRGSTLCCTAREDARPTGFWSLFAWRFFPGFAFGRLCFRRLNFLFQILQLFAEFAVLLL